jgi:hypothetical protein
MRTEGEKQNEAKKPEKTWDHTKEDVYFYKDRMALDD